MSTYTTQLSTVTFTALADSWSEEPQSEVNVIGFPGGDSVAISIAGQRETRRTFTVLLDDIDEYEQLRDMRAKEGWLKVDGWDAAAKPAVLVTLKPDVPWASGEITATANFILY